MTNLHKLSVVKTRVYDKLKRYLHQTYTLKSSKNNTLQTSTNFYTPLDSTPLCRENNIYNIYIYIKITPKLWNFKRYVEVCRSLLKWFKNKDLGVRSLVEVW